MKDPAYIQFLHFLIDSVIATNLMYVEDHPGYSLTPDTSAAREILVRTLVGIAYRRFPRNKIGQYMVDG